MSGGELGSCASSCYTHYFSYFPQKCCLNCRWHSKYLTFFAVSFFVNPCFCQHWQLWLILFHPLAILFLYTSFAYWCFIFTRSAFLLLSSCWFRGQHFISLPFLILFICRSVLRKNWKGYGVRISLNRRSRKENNKSQLYQHFDS